MTDTEEQMELELEFGSVEQMARDLLLMNTYQHSIEKLIVTEGDERLIENTLGLVGEAGEVAEKVKKFIRDGKIDVGAVKRELGDVLFYVAALATWIEEDLSEVALENLEKLEDRKRRGVIQGSGDNR